MLTGDVLGLRIALMFARVGREDCGSYSDVVDPDVGGASKGDGITAPDVLRVQVRDLDVLNDDVVDAVGHAEALALDDTLAALTDDGLVGGDLNTCDTGSVVGDGVDSGSVRLVVVAPVILVDGLLACASGAPGSATTAGGGALGGGEVEAARVRDGRLSQEE